MFGKKRREILDSAVLPYLANPHEDELAFDLKLAQRWLLQRVLDLGWSAERFGYFDREVARSRASEGRAAHKPERIGKKYQWIAWHELLARLADNFVFRGDGFDDEESEYQGPWQLLGARDIDPSCLESRTKAEVWTPRGRTWWTPTAYSAWSEDDREDEWIRRNDDLPRVEQFLEVTRPDGSCWLPMEVFCLWEQPTPPEEERYHTRRRELWYSIRAYLVRRRQADAFFDWALRQDFMGRWMPESARLHEVFLGEVYWSPALASIRNPYHGLVDWQQSERLPSEVLVPSVTYSAESGGFDCSVEDSFSVHIPSPWIAERMKLSWRGREGEYYDPSGKLVALDPSVNEHGSGALLMEREAFLGFLEANDCDVMWTVLGEKQVMPGDFLPQRRVWLEVSGAYRLRNGKPTGRLNFKFEESELP